MTASPQPPKSPAARYILPVVIVLAILIYAIPVLLTRRGAKDLPPKNDGAQSGTGGASQVSFSSGGPDAGPDAGGATDPEGQGGATTKGAGSGADPADDPNSVSTSGLVVDKTNKPVGGVRLVAYPMTPNLGSNATLENPYVTVSLADGRFRFRNTPKSPVRVLRITTDFGGEWSIQGPVQANPGDANVRVVVAPVFSSGRLFGKVIEGGTKAPIPDFEVLLQEAIGKMEIKRIITDATGAFEFRNLRASAYRILSPPVSSGRSLREIVDPSGSSDVLASPASGVVSISESYPAIERTLILGGPVRLSGKVLDHQTGKPFGGAMLGLAEGTGDGQSKLVVDLTAVSGPEGEFVFENCSPALRPWSEGPPMVGIFLRNENQLLAEAAGGGPGSFIERDYGVYWAALGSVDADEIKGLELRVQNAAQLNGIVAHKDGRPFEGAEFFAARSPQIILQSPLLIQRQGVTGKDGRFSLRVSPFTTIHAGARTPNGGIFFSEPVPIAGAAVETKIIVEDDVTVDGLVLDQGGQIVQGAEVTLSLMAGEAIKHTMTDAEGRFTFMRPGGSRTVVQAIKEGFFPSETMEANRYDSGVPIILILAEPARVRGRVVDEAGQPVQGANLGLFGDGSSDLQEPIAPTGPDGIFDFGPVRKGKSYSALVAKGNIDAAAYGLVAGGEEKTIVLKLDIVLNCKIMVKNALGDPVKNYVVSFHPSQTYPVDRNPSGSGPWQAASDTGVLELKLAPNADFFFEITAEGIGATTTNLMSWDYASNLPEVNKVVFEFPVVLGSVHTVSGRVVTRGDQSKGLAGLPVRMPPLLATQGPGPAAVTTSTDGSFVFEPAASGGYKLIIEGPGRPPFEAPIYISSPEQAKLGNIPYFGLGNLNVRVRDSEGPVAGAWVELQSAEGMSGFLPNQQTSSDGYARWAQLPEGDYQIRLPSQNRVTQAQVLADKDAEVDVTLGSYVVTVNILHRGGPLLNAWAMIEPASGDGKLSAVTDGTGMARVSGLVAGDYTVRPLWPTGYFAPQGITFSPFTAPSQPLTLQGDPMQEQPTLTFVMPSGLIAGAVTEEYIPSPDNMGPILELFRSGDRSQRIITRPDALGFFFLPGLPAGNWELEFTSDQSHGIYHFALGEGQEITELVLPEEQPQQP